MTEMLMVAKNVAEMLTVDGVELKFIPGLAVEYLTVEHSMGFHRIRRVQWLKLKRS